MLGPLLDLLRPEAASWAQLKLRLGTALAMDPDLLHLYGGVLVLCAAALVLRRHPLSRWPWLVLLVLETGNELADLMLDGMGSPEATVGAGLHDLWNTMLAPTLLSVTAWLVGRLRR